MTIGSRFRLAVAAAIVAMCGFAAPALATDEEKDHGGAKQEEKDQTKFMGIKSYDLGIYTLIVFGGLFLILGKYAWKPVMDGLQKREDAILQARTDAETARGEAQKLLDEIKAQRGKSNDEVVAIIAQARKDADAFRDSEKARTAADIQAERERLKREIETARDQALKEIWMKTVDLATMVSTKAIRRELSVEDHRRLIDEALVELKQNV
jgi:F-type H+-transporting ATPase subunit b